MPPGTGHQSVSWTGRERLLCPWYPFRLTVQNVADLCVLDRDPLYTDPRDIPSSGCS